MKFLELKDSQMSGKNALLTTQPLDWLRHPAKNGQRVLDFQTR
jgi:hypothetical protein